jgi:hypothetical protein
MSLFIVIANVLLSTFAGYVLYKTVIIGLASEINSDLHC